MKIEIKMKGIYGTLYYLNGNDHYEIPVEHTGDYQNGLLVFINDIDNQISSGNILQKKSEVRRALQTWGKENNTKFYW
jgi:hypothetical protein